LVDLENLDQTKAAGEMKISQSTLQRILTAARKKVSEALIKGRAIKIEGGVFKMTRLPVRQFKCEDCGNIWEVPFGAGKRGRKMECPKCNSSRIHRIDYGGHGFGHQPWGYKRKS
jgi:predicted Zn-ribbon and HTH transcriptional regulator